MDGVVWLFGLVAIVVYLGRLVHQMTMGSRITDLEQQMAARSDSPDASTQLAALERRIEALEHRTAQSDDGPALDRLAQLTRRVYALEHGGTTVVPHIPEPVKVVEPPKIEPPVEPPPVAPPPITPESPQPEPIAPPPPPPPLPPTPVFTPDPGPTISDRLRAWIGTDEWETLVGSSLLNKLGALVLVVGIALLLGYSFARITPAGRAAMAFAISAGILVAGVRVERMDRYRFFARGLIGAGWAGLYATAYAVYALPAARIIDDPFLGSLGLLAVAAGMIAHSLRYRAQAVTGLAYTAAFLALSVTPSSPFAAVSLIPLAASLLWLAAKSEWYTMPVFGMAATWATLMSRGDSGAPLEQTQPLFLAYWLIFEAFDLLRTRRRIVTGGVEWLYPVNLAAATGLSYLAWHKHASDDLWLAMAGGALILAVDAIIRGYLRPPHTFTDEHTFADRLMAGSFELSTLGSALLGGLSIVAHVPGVWMTVGLAMEAEILYLLGWKLDIQFLRGLAYVAFGHSLLRIWLFQVPSQSKVIGHDMWNWTPPALLHTSLFYFNRAIRRPNAAMSWAAALLLVAVIGGELPLHWAGMVWIAFGLALFEFGSVPSQVEFRGQAPIPFALGLAASILSATVWVPSDFVSIPLVFGLLLVYSYALRVPHLEIDEAERGAVGHVLSGAAIALAATLIHVLVPAPYCALAWTGLAYAVLELGIQELPPQMRVFFPLAGVAALASVLVVHPITKTDAADKLTWLGVGLIACLATFRTWKQEIERSASSVAAVGCLGAAAWLTVPPPFISLAWTALALAALELDLLRACVIAFAAVYVRLFAYDVNNAPLSSTPWAIATLYWLWHRKREEYGSAILLWVPLLPLLALVAKEGDKYTAPGWIVIAIVLWAAGLRFPLEEAKQQALAVATLAGMAICIESDAKMVPAKIATIAGLYLCQFLARPEESPRANAYFSVLGSLLLCQTLFEQVTGGMLTVSWGATSVVLLAVGFTFRERVLRLSGLALLMCCILKLFLYDLRNLETFYRILSFIALGAILLGVSWIYTRFREHIQKLL